MGDARLEAHVCCHAGPLLSLDSDAILKAQSSSDSGHERLTPSAPAMRGFRDCPPECVFWVQGSLLNTQPWAFSVDTVLEALDAEGHPVALAHPSLMVQGCEPSGVFYSQE